MHRRTLVLRRFGDLSFGLGYFENGTWIDHQSTAAREVVAASSAADRAALDAIHTWFDCCRETPVAIPIAAEAAASARG